MNRAFCFLLVLLPSAWVFGRGHWDSYWWGKWAVLLAVMLLAVTVQVSLRIHWSLGPAMLSTTLGALGIVGWSRSHYSDLGPEDFFILRNSAAYLLIALLVFALFFSSARKRTIQHLLDAFGWLCLVDSSVTIFQWATHEELLGLFGNPSMSACLIAATLPLLSRVTKNPFWMIVPLFAIALTKTSMGIGTAAVALLVLYARNLKVLAAVVAGFFVLGAFAGPQFYFFTERKYLWLQAWRWWWSNANHWIGTGAGSLFYLVPTIQQQANPNNTSYYMFLHNDWGQILFEQGYIGLAAALLVFVYAIQKTLRYRSLLAAVLAYGASGVGNFPLHMPVHALLGATLFSAAFKWERPE